MSDLDDLKANAPQVQPEAYGQHESPAAQKQKDRTAERQAQREQRRIDRINKELRQQREIEVRKFAQAAKPAPLAAPIPLGGDQNVRRFTETPAAPAPDESRVPIKSDNGSGADAARVTLGGIEYDSSTDSFTAILADVSVGSITPYDG